MKFALRAFVFAIVVLGAFGASFSSHRSATAVSHLSATSAFPGPGCGPGMGCAVKGK